MDPTQVVLFALLGAVLGAGVVLAWCFSEHMQRREPRTAEPVVPPGVASVLSVLRSSALLVGEDDQVLKASAAAYALGLVRGREICVPELADLVHQVRRDGEIRTTELVLTNPGQPPTHVTARVAKLSSQLVLGLVEDRTRERHIETIRRDFVANVSHELKTPVGALRVLAEAVIDAADDPEAVKRFAGRMLTESDRLSQLVGQIIELSRLQGDEQLDRPELVHVDRIVEDAIDRSAIDAHAKHIQFAHQGQHGLQVLGDADQLTLALGNLVANAVAYSPERSRIVVGAKEKDQCVEITVTDQGVGIPADELDRIFERFYRVDRARHRSTGGTGLGLSIVKHVAASHGGEVRVWSAEGQGSTFTLSLPRRTTGEGVRRTAPSPTVADTGRSNNDSEATT